MVQEAEKFANEDKLKREHIELKNQAELLCYQSEKQVEELKEKVSTESIQSVNNLIAKTRESLIAENYPELKENLSGLTEALGKMQQEIILETELPKPIIDLF